jgi:hypothetical protein
MCSKRSYWDPIFKRKGLNMPSINYKTPEGWIIEYEKELLLQYKIGRLFNILENQTIEDFYNEVGIDEQILMVHSSKFPFNLVKFDEMDEQIMKHWNKWIILQSKNLTKYGIFNENFPAPEISMYLDDNNQYHIDFGFATNDIDLTYYPYIVSKASMGKFFYLLLSSNVDIYNVNNNNVRY